MTNHPLRIALAMLAASTSCAIAAPCPTTVIAPETGVPAGAVGAGYSQTFSASGATAPYVFAVTSGLPASSGLAFAPAGTDSANLTGTPTEAGDHIVTVTATDVEGCSGGRTYALSIAPGDQIIEFTSSPPVDASIGGTPYAVAATSTSNLSVSFSIDAVAAAVCSISGDSVSFQGAGTCVVNANQAGDGNWNPAPQAQQSFNVGAADQTITFTSTPPTDAAVAGATYAVSATATSGLPVSFAIDAGANTVCSIAGSIVSFQGAGTCVINADQAGDAEWDPAPQVQQSFNVARGDQTIGFTSTAPAGASVGGSAYAASATATSGLPVAFTVDATATSVCAVAGASVTFHGTGTCIVNANQAGDANWNPAPQVQQSFAVGPGNQAITFTSTPPSDAAVAGNTYDVSATATSGLPVTFAIDAGASAVCSIAGTSVSFQTVGTCVINANQAGDGSWNPAPQAQQSFAVGPGDQTITFTSTPPPAAVAGATYAVSATATSGLAVTFSIDASAAGVCSIAGTTVSFHGAGTCVIDADQAGDANWNPAPQAQQGFPVDPGSQTIAFTSTAPANASVGGTTYEVAASATSGLPVAFTIDASAASVCAVAGSTVSFLAGGTCVINANQAGDANWNPAPQVQQSFSVSTCLSLAVGQVVTAQMPGGADFCVLNGDAANAEFTYLPIHAGTSGEPTLDVLASNVVPATGPPTPIAPSDAGKELAPLADAAAGEVHAIDESLPVARGEAVDASHLVREVHGVVPPFPGQLLDLDASVGGCSVAPDVRKARVEAVTAAVPGQQRLYAAQEVVESSPGAGDWHPPVPGGFATVDFQNIIDAFVQAPPGQTGNGSGALGGLLRIGAMDALTTYFGGVTDVDGNGGVLVFFTPKLNELSPPASSSVAQALFQVRDLLSASSCPGSNEGEILYMLVPDPTGAVNSNVRTLSFVYGSAEPMLVHHAAHLAHAARRLYSVGGPQELAWLEEAVAWEMQELIFFNASVGLVPRTNIGLTELTTGPNASVRVAAFNTFENPIYGNMRTYFHQFPGTFGGRRFGPLRQLPWTVPGVTLHDQTAAPYAITSTFLRYALDRRNTGDAALIGALVNSSQTGIANLEAVFGMDAEEWLRDFLVAMYAEDAGIPGVAAQYTAPSWNYRSVYSGLGGYPLVTNPLGDGVALSFGLTHGGGTRYLRFGVAPGQVANVTLTEGGAPPSSPIATALVRTR